MRSAAWLMLTAAAAVGAAVIGVEHNPVRTHPTGIPAGAAQNIIVKLRATSSTQATEQEHQREQQRIEALAARTGLGLESSREIMTRLHVIHVRPAGQGASIAQTIARLQADPDVEYAEPDQRRYIHQAPDDPLYDGSEQDDGAALQQWYEQAPLPGATTSATPSAVDAADAWNVTTGSNAIVIADIDNGVRFDHPDLLGAGTGATVSATATPTGRLLSGYCFITDSFVANGIDCPGPDASDPGDWVTSADLSKSECSGESTADSSWHGTRVAGILGALTNNATGMAGMTWNTWILPLRALGVCGGQDSDIETAMLWAAGVQVQGYPTNPYPAKIINMSIGGASACPSSYQDVISTLSGMGVLVVVSAGNEGGPVDAPGNCPGVVAVAGLREAGTKVGYSDLGTQVALSAPAGNCVNTADNEPCLYSIISATNLGTTTPAQNGYTTDIIIDQNPSLGTSFSAPIVSGIAALMLAVNGNLTPSQLTTLLEQSSTPFPQTSEGESSQPPMCQNPTTFGDDTEDVECICTNPSASVPVTCGYGMANASAAVTAALDPIAAISVQTTTVTPGSPVTLSASGSGAACGDSIASYEWSSSSSSDPVSSSSGATTAVNAPTSGTVTVTLTVTDSAGHSSRATASIDSTSAGTTAPASAGSTACLTPITVVSVAPNGPSAPAGGDPVAFTASVGDNTDSAVTWQVNGVTGGSTLYGTISSSGLYTPPATQPASNNVTVSAVSVADPTRSGWTQLTITAQGSGSSSSSSSNSSNSSSSSSSSSNSSSSSSASSSSTQSGSGSSASPVAGKGGGGGLDWVTLLACGFLVALRSQRRAWYPSAGAFLGPAGARGLRGRRSDSSARRQQVR